MKTNVKKLQKGFTIIEVMIVLAIAGLILAIVLFAVPALQRNGRNSQIRTTANTLLGYLSEYQSNNNGNTPKCISVAANGNVTLGATGSGMAPTCATGVGSVVGKIQGGYTILAGPTTGTSPAASTLYIGLTATCAATAGTGGTITFTSSGRASSVGYGVETNSGVVANCSGS